MYRAPPLAKGSKKEVPALSLKPLANSLMAERAGFEPARELLTPYSISNRAPSAILSHLSIDYSIVFMLDIACFSGGESEIRTHEAVISRLLDFESSAFDQLGHLSLNYQKTCLVVGQLLPAILPP